MKWKDISRVEVYSDKVSCKGCGHNILDITNIKYAGETRSYERYTEELCECRNCGEKFIIRYNIFDKKGHIEPKIFMSDVNDLKHNWQDNLTKKQLKAVEEHLRSCGECQDTLNEELLDNAWFASILRGKKK